jgi:hypothetical protein
MDKKQIILWKKSNICKNILNKKIPLTSELQNKIEITYNITITENDIKKFPEILSTLPNYDKKIYRGVYQNDNLYNELLYDRATTTKEYISFTKKLEKASQSGEKIILSLNSTSTYDLTNYSEDEVILDKNTKIQIISREYINNLLFINLIIL